MKFNAAFSYMKNGHRIAMPEWGGYWTWCDEAKTVVMHTRHGAVVDIRDSEDMDYTLSFMLRDDWELLDEEAVTEHDEAWENMVAFAEEGELEDEEEECCYGELMSLILGLLYEDEEECDCEECREEDEFALDEDSEEDVETVIVVLV